MLFGGSDDQVTTTSTVSTAAPYSSIATLAQTSTPYVSTVQPATSTPAPVTQTAAPVTQTAAPVTQTAAPVTQTVAPLQTSAVSILATTTPPAPWMPTNPSWNMLNMSNWNACLYNDLKLYQCDGSQAQERWAYDPSGLLVNKFSNKCLQAAGTSAGAGISLNPCDVTNSMQQWTMNDNRIRLKSNPNLVAELPAYDYSRPVALWTDNNGGNQYWFKNP